MTDKNPKSFRGPRAWGLLAALTLTTVAAAWATRSTSSDPTHDPHWKRLLSVGAADGPLQASTRVDRGAVLQGGDGIVRMELLLRGEERPLTGEAMASDLVVLLDRSGSMNGEKIDQARSAVKELIERLGPSDRFSLVSFNGSASVDLPLQPATEEHRREWARRVDGIGSGGGTCIRCALEVGVSIIEEGRSVERASRVLLISDGLSDANGLTELASRAARGESIVSSIGVGLDFNEQLMSSVADAGAGNFYFLENAATLARVFEGEFLAARSTVASALSVSLSPGPGIEVLDAAGYPLERSGGSVVFRPGALFSGQERRIWISYRLPVDEPQMRSLGLVSIGYRDGEKLGSLVVDELPLIACVRDEARFREKLDAKVALEALKKESFGALRQEVGLSVGAGRRDEARERVQAYRRQVEGLVAMAPAAAGEAQVLLDEVSELEQDADQAFVGTDRALKQKSFSKDNAAQGWEMRRSGAKALPQETK